MTRLGRPAPPRFLRNALSLYVIQGLQYLSPFIVLPVLIQGLGMRMFGVLMFWQALVNGAGIIVEYGFNYSGVRELGRIGDCQKSISKLYFSIFYAKILLFFPAAVFLSVIYFFIPESMKYSGIFLLAILSIIGVSISPVWYLAGLKQNQELAVASFVTQFFYVVGILFFVRDVSDFYAALAIQFSLPLFNSLIANVIVFFKFRPQYSPVKVRDIFAVMRSGWMLFISTSSAGIYSSVNPFLLGMVSSPFQVAAYSLGERLARAVQSLLNPMMSTLYPYAVASSGERNGSFVRLVSIVLCLIAFFLMLVLIFFAPWLVDFIGKAEFHEAAIVTQILAANIFFVTIGNVVGVQYLVARGWDKSLLVVTLVAAVLHLMIFMLSGKRYGALGGAITYITIEALVSAALIAIALRKRGL